MKNEGYIAMKQNIFYYLLLFYFILFLKRKNLIK